MPLRLFPLSVRYALLALSLLATVTPSLAQYDEGVLPLDDPLHQFLLRQQAAGHLSDALLTALPLSAYEAQALLDTLATRADELPSIDRTRLARFQGEQFGPGVGLVHRQLSSSLYSDGETLVAAQGDGYTVRIQPLAYLSRARARRSAAPGENGMVSTWQNTRGARAAGHVGGIFFEARLEENQQQPVWNERDFHTAPRLSFVEGSGSTYDYVAATGLIGYRSRFFEVRLGRDQNNWGFGEGSLALSDYAAPYDQVQVRTRFWRLQYTNLFARRIEPFQRAPGESLVSPRHWMALHQLAIDLPLGLQAELFETVLFSDDTLSGRRSGFDVAYLNPMVSFRAAETDLGSPDNLLIGAGLAWNAAPGYRLYSQLLLDELSVKELGSDWWANKWGVLLGARLADPGVGNYRIRGLDLQLEYARLRPYLYGHRHISTAFLHNGDGLGHPAGPNAWDLAMLARYRPLPRVETALTAAFTRRGRNTETENYGSDITIPYNSRVGDYGIETLQGVPQDQWLLEGRAGYEVLPSLFVEGTLRYEAIEDELLGLDRYLAVGAQLRWGLPFQSVRY